MKFKEVPEFLQIPEALEETYNFTYDPKNEFVVGEVQIKKEEFGEFSFSVPQRATPVEKPEDIVVATSLFGIMTGPSVYKWILEQGNNYITTIRSLMRNVMSEIIDDEIPERTEGGGFGFDLMRINNHGHYALSVLGNCACMGPDPTSFEIEESEWSSGYAKYVSHNIDMEAQRTGLLAGLGYLSYLVQKHDRDTDTI